LPLPLSELFICWMSRSTCSWVLISIKSTMIIAGGHHGIRLYEREVQPHDLCRHWHCQAQPLCISHIFWWKGTHEAVQIHEWRWWLPNAAVPPWGAFLLRRQHHHRSWIHGTLRRQPCQNHLEDAHWRGGIILKMHPWGALLRLPFFTTDTKK